MRVRERCACGGRVDASGDNPAAAVLAWREDHACDRRPPPATDETGAAVLTPTAPPPVGFSRADP